MAQGVYDAFLPYNCLNSIKSSFNTLKFLRINGCGPSPTEYQQFDLSVFTKLEFLSYDSALLLNFAVSEPGSLPSSLRAIQLYSYFFPPPPPKPFKDEETLLKVLEKKAPKNLEMCIVPEKPTDRYLNAAPSGLDSWKRQREAFKKAKIFKDGKIKLKILREDQTSEYQSS